MRIARRTVRGASGNQPDGPGEVAAIPLPEPDGSVGHSFGLEFDGVLIKNIAEVNGLKLEQDVIELKENTADGGYSIKRLPGRWKAGECTFTRGLTDDRSFEKWIKDSQAGGPGARKNGSVIVYDFEGKQIKRYTITNAWPRSLEIGTLKAGDTTVLTEKLVLTYEQVEFG
jgi:phage tail-like protein